MKCKGPDHEGCAMCDCETEEDKVFKKLKIHPLKPFPSVYLEVGVKGESFGIIEFELFSNTPKTSENFRQLCTGEAGCGT